MEAFKLNFFKANAELTLAKVQITALEQQLNFEEVKKRIIQKYPSPSVDSIKEREDILYFLEQSLKATGYDGVVQLVFHSIENLELDMAIQINDGDEKLNYSFDDESRDSNIVLLEQHKEMEESSEQTDILFFNLSHLSVMVRKLSTIDEPNTEKLDEFINIIVHAANSRIEFLKKDIELETLRRNIYGIFKKTRTSFEDVQDNVDNQIMAVSELFLAYEKYHKENLVKMSLSEKNTKILNMLVYETKMELNLLLTSGLTIDEKFLQSIIKLEDAYSVKYSDDD